MNYPFWDTGIGYGVLMAVIAIVHVFVSHFAIGGGLYLVIAESAARRAGDTARLAFLEKLTKFFVLISVVFGALTGVGIWFIIGLLNPAATEVLIHHFVWGWAIEWTFFVVEICAAIVYYYGWRTMSPVNHIRVGWIYFGAAWMSLFVINGIIGFMLTPGQWLETGSFWHGFFNPSYWPSLVLRTGICLLLAGVYAMVVASRPAHARIRQRLVRYNARWVLAGLVVIVPSFLWYWQALPAEVASTALERMNTPRSAFNSAFMNLAVLTVLVVLFGLLMPKRLNTTVSAVLMVLALVFFGGFEWSREAARKPYVISGYMYGNAVEVAKQDPYTDRGYLAHIRFRTGDDGADLFRHACRSCHTIDGYQPLAPVFDGTDPEYIAALTRSAHLLKSVMPPFYGTEEEADKIAQHIWSRVDRRPFQEIYGLEGAQLGRKIWEIRCGICHEPGGYRDNLDVLAGLEREDFEDILDNGEDYGEGMPDFSGDDLEREALLLYLLSLEEGGEQ
jgi:mono/diheme cytochrome c family protein